MMKHGGTSVHVIVPYAQQGHPEGKHDRKVSLESFMKPLNHNSCSHTIIWLKSCG
jgi:hypothetical protein